MDIPFVQARWYTRGRKGGVDLIVIHDMEAPESDKTAENVAQNFRTTDRQASTHYCIDNDSIVQCVRDEDTAWAAPGANANGLQLEHAGYASQRISDWTDGYSTAELGLSAQLTYKLCQKFKIPAVYVDAEGLKAGKRGITTHRAVTAAFHKSDHTDPGPNFPMDLYLSLVLGGSIVVPPLAPPQGGSPVSVNAPVVALLTHDSWDGYIEVGADGGTFAFEAPGFGSLGATKLNANIVGGDVTPTGKGYWLVGADGGVYAFGDAEFFGSTGNIHLNQPVVGLRATKTGKGYWLIAKDGGLFSYGDAPFKGTVQYAGG